jgi:predicted nucleic acid-binding protein
MSGRKFLIDSNVVIGLLDGREAAQELVRAAGATPDLCAVSQMTRLELLSFHGLTEAAKIQVEWFLAKLQVIPLDERIEDATIALRRRTRLKLPDAIIAATARVHGLTLLTLDERLRSALEVSLG